MFTKLWWGRAFERMAKTAAQALISLLGTDALGWAHLDYVFIGRTAAIMAALSFLSSIVTSAWGDRQDPSAVG